MADNFTEAGLAALHQSMQGLVDDGTWAGVVTLVEVGDERHVDAVGVADLSTGEALADDAVFRIQSMTKAVSATATLQLIERGHLALDDAVDRWLPELAERKVLRTPTSPLDDVVPATGPITVEHLLNCRSGYGAIFADPADSPIMTEMNRRGVSPGGEPFSIGADEWLARFADLPTIHQPGEGWRYHTSYELLGILLSRVVGQPLDDVLGRAVFQHLAMADTGLWARPGQAHHLVAAYRADDDGRLVEAEPAKSGFYAAEPPFDISHGELVSTVHDYARFARMLINGGTLDGEQLLTAASVAAMTTDQVPESCKTDDAFFPGFWNHNGWGYGVGTSTDPGRPFYGWDGGYGTTFFNDPSRDLTAVMMPQLEYGEAVMQAITTFRDLVYDALADRG